MERFPGTCPGRILRYLDDAIQATEPLVTHAGESLYRVTLADGRSMCIVVLSLSKFVVTVMTLPCKAHVASRVYQITETGIEKVKNEQATFRHDKWRCFRKARQTRERFL
jgi:hypothetical protein